jgi:antitoxin (DNA-binding transcriptional repressor) of toxin-antitoxin stability system
VLACVMIERRRGDPDELVEVATGSYLSEMKTVGIKELKNKLSEYVQLAKSGEIVSITHRGEVVAELRAPTPWKDPMMEDPWFAEQVRKGLITPRRIPPGTPLNLEHDGPRVPFEQVMRELDESREDRF